jgi:hypothetical protein
MNQMDTQESRSEVDRNYAAFKALLPDLIATHPGKFAVMHNGEVVEFFDTLSDAVRCGSTQFGGSGKFSVQEVTSTPANLGFYAYAVCVDSLYAGGPYT